MDFEFKTGRKAIHDGRIAEIERYEMRLQVRYGWKYGLSTYSRPGGKNRGGALSTIFYEPYKIFICD